MSSGQRVWTGKRRALVAVGVLSLIGGLSLMVVGFLGWITGGPELGDPDFGAQVESAFVKTILFMLGGVGLCAIGAFMLYGALLRPVTEYVAGAAGRGLAGAGMGPREQVVKIKCRSCGHVQEENSKFCSECGEPL